MIYQERQLINMTRVLMGRHRQPRQLLHCHDPDSLRLNEVILTVIEPAAREVYATSPVWMLAASACELDADDIYWQPETDGTYSALIPLPDDYMRLHVVEMSDWHRPVYDTTDAPGGDSDSSGVRGNPWAPRCTVRAHASGRVLHLHSSLSTDATLVQGKYIAWPALEHGGMELSPYALYPVVKRAAEMTTAIINPESIPKT